METYSIDFLTPSFVIYISNHHHHHHHFSADNDCFPAVSSNFNSYGSLPVVSNINADTDREDDYESMSETSCIRFVYIYKYIHTYKYIYIYTYVNIYIYIYIYKYTY
jgi:hypothetical protein